MFDSLTRTLGSLLGKFSGSLTPEQIEPILKELRTQLLSADVHPEVTRVLCDELKTEALSQKASRSLDVRALLTQVFYKKLVEVMGGEEQSKPEQLFSQKPPVVVLVSGLQGSGKTTFCAKLALFLKKKLKRDVGLVPLDGTRPAAVAQLKILAQKAGVACMDTDLSQGVLEASKKVLPWAQREFFEVVIVDTSGRQQIDESLMKELSEVQSILKPQVRLLVLDGMIGTMGLDVAQEFHHRLQLSGLVISKLDGDTRSGVALSARSRTGVPLVFASTGEKLEDLEPFYPQRAAQRILDQGDLESLLEKAQDHISEASAEVSVKKVMKGQFSLEDFALQMAQIQKMGSMESLLKMLPGGQSLVSQLPAGLNPEAEMKKLRAMIDSMTQDERRDHKLLNGSRRARISKGSGVPVSEINRLIQQFDESQKMMQKLMSGNFLKGGLGALGRLAGGRGGFPRR